ncbi:MAG: cell division protein SepF [Candidatus Bathyarchaeia archaeon]
MTSETESAAEATTKAAEKPKTTTYVKALPLSDYVDISKIKNELDAGNILIVKITPMAEKSIEDVKSAIDELKSYVETIGGDIARLGEERIVVTPSPIRIWRKKAIETITTQTAKPAETDY